MSSQPFARPTRTPLGLRKDGRPFYAILGASDGPPEGGDAAAQAAAAADAAAAAAGQGAATGEVDPADANMDAAALAAKYTPAQLAAYALSLRKKDGDNRMNAKRTAAEEARTEMAQEIGKALGLIKGDEKLDPAKLASELDASKAAQREATIELEVFRSAGEHLGNAAQLVDSRTFIQGVRDLDPTAEDFRAKVVAAAKAAVAANPQLKAVREASRAGGEFTGGSGEGRDASKVQPGRDRMAYAYETNT